MDFPVKMFAKPRNASCEFAISPLSSEPLLLSECCECMLQLAREQTLYLPLITGATFRHFVYLCRYLAKLFPSLLRLLSYILPELQPQPNQ